MKLIHPTDNENRDFGKHGRRTAVLVKSLVEPLRPGNK